MEVRQHSNGRRSRRTCGQKLSGKEILSCEDMADSVGIIFGPILNFHGCRRESTENKQVVNCNAELRDKEVILIRLVISSHGFSDNNVPVRYTCRASLLSHSVHFWECQKKSIACLACVGITAFWGWVAVFGINAKNSSIYQ